MKNRAVKKIGTAAAKAMVCLCMLMLSCPAEADGVYSPFDLFTDRDLRQTAKKADIVFTVRDGENVQITEEGVYTLTGTAKNTVVYVNVGKEEKVQLVLDGLNIANEQFPCIYVDRADKVFVTTKSDSALRVTGRFENINGKKTDAVIMSRDDLVLNGTAQLTIESSESGIVGKDDVKITGGSYAVSAAAKAIEANDSICIADGKFNLYAGTDGLHAENNDDDLLGYIYIENGEFDITAGDDGIHAQSVMQIDGGTFRLTAGEGIESTYIQINGGDLAIKGANDGINGAHKSMSYEPTIEINGGKLRVTVGDADSDGIDCNGTLIIREGAVSVDAESAFDIDGEILFSGGSVTVNGQPVSELP